jgi:K(+)-stimulated pyrophosphate-energized sodium pump
MLALMSLPLIIGGVCILTSIIGTYFVRLGRSQSIMGALYKGFWLTAGLSIPAIFYVMWQTLNGDMNAVIGGAAEAAGSDVATDVARPRSATASPAWTCSIAPWSASPSPA